MTVSHLGGTLALLLVLGVATERWVAIAATVFPRLAGGRRSEALDADPAADRARRLGVQGVALAGAWVASACVAGEGVPTPAAFGGFVRVGTLTLPTPLVALLACGSSTLWTQAVQCAGAVKDIAQARRSAERLALRARAERMGVAPVEDAGCAATDRRSRLRLQLGAHPPDRLDAPARRPG